ncbi:zinc finger BED domain-containing protein 5-like [Styela clava]
MYNGELFARKVQEAVNNSALSNNTITRLIQTIAADLKEQILEDFRNSPWTALAVNESTDTTAQAQLLIFGRFLKGSSVTEELLACISPETTTRGEDIFSGIDKFFTENNLNWNKVIECSIDGAPSMMGKNIGVLGILSREYPHIKINHCKIHRPNWASKNLSPNFSDEFNAMIDVDFHGELDFGEAKKDLLDYLRNLTENMNLRFKDLIAESFDFVQFPFKTDIFITNCGAIALEMAELQADDEARFNFDVFQGSVLDTVTKQVFSS